MSQIDQAALDNIRALQRPNSPDLVGRIVTIFMTQTPDGVKAILDGIESSDLEAVRTAAHSIKSTAAYVGATQFSKRMEGLEKAARTEQLALCQELAVGLQDHTAQVIDELAPYLGLDKAV